MKRPFHRSIHWLQLSVLLVALLFAVVGCGEDDSDSAGPGSDGDDGGSECAELVDALLDCRWEGLGDLDYDALLFVCEQADRTLYECLDRVRDEDQTCDAWIEQIDDTCLNRPDIPEDGARCDC